MWHCCLCLLSPSLALLAASSVQAEGWKNPGGWVQLGGRNDGDPHFAVDCASGWGGGGWGLALLPAAGAGCPGVGSMHPAGFIYKQSEAGTGQPGTSGTEGLMLIITT